MKEKKEKNIWILALINYFLGGFFWPLVLGLVLGPVLGHFIFPIALSSTPLYLFSIALLRFIFVAVGAIWSARFVNKRYLILDKQKIVNISILYMIIMGIIANLLKYLDGSLDLLTDPIYFIIGIFTFYFMSRLRLKSDLVNSNY